jgi:general secretion pathway protein B
MSFILDALKKSESDRQRQGGPALFEVKVARARARWPLWAIAIGALLALNLSIITWMLVRHPARGDGGSAAPPTSTAAGTSTAAAAAPLAANTGAVSAPAGAAPQSATPVAFAPPASAASQPPAPANAGGAAATVAEQNAADYAPAAEPAAASLSHVRRTTAEGVPLYQDAAATPGSQLPQLRLDLHVFAARPEDRFVMINMHKLREGDSLPDGVHVDSITADGVVLTYNGSRFLLPRD